MLPVSIPQFKACTNFFAHGQTILALDIRKALPSLLYGDGLGEIAWLVNIAAAADGDVIGQQLKGHDFNERGEQLESWRDMNDVLHQAADRGVALSGYGDHAAGAGGDLLNVGESLFIAKLR